MTSTFPPRSSPLRTDRGFSRIALPLAALLVGASQLSAQDPRLAARLPHGTALAIQALMDSAGRQGLPTDPLVQKALEGQSKGADSAQIIAAVHGLLTRLETGRAELGPNASEADLVAAAAALRAGASSASLHALRLLRPNQPLFVPLSVLADLMTEGIPADRAWDSVREMASSGASDAAFLSLRDRMTGTSGGGTSPRLPPVPERPPGNQRPDRPEQP